MLIIGAGGLAKEVADIIVQTNITKNLYFFDDVNLEKNLFIENFQIFHTREEVLIYFQKCLKIVVGIGNPKLREKFYNEFSAMGAKFENVISKESYISEFDISMGNGNILFPGVKVSSGVKIGSNNLIYYNSILTHDVEIGNHCEISPNVTILGNSKIGNRTHLATGSIIFPNVEIGCDVVVAAGAVVRENVPDNVMIAGVPAIIKKSF